MLRPTDDVATDGYQFIITGVGEESSKLIVSENELYKYICTVIPTKIVFKQVTWVSDFRFVPLPLPFTCFMV